MKICSKCKIEKSRSDFYVEVTNKDGVRSSCKVCAKKPRTQYIKLQSKTCKTCKVNKSINNFDKNKLSTNGYGSYCEKYSKTKSRKFKINKYRITPEEYYEMLVSQDYKCSICFKEQEISKPLRIDYCHKTNKVRGLLCNNCNVALGLFQDNPHILVTALIYLEQSKE